MEVGRICGFRNLKLRNSKKIMLISEVIGKDGEIFDPVANTWTLLSGADVDVMLTDDHEGKIQTPEGKIIL